jgi:hypothetical protein
MTKLRQLHDRYGQSPWPDNLTRGDLVGGRLRRLVDQGIQGVASNPTIIAKAFSGSADDDRQLATLAAQGHDAEASVAAARALHRRLQAQARLAYRLFRDRFGGPRWAALAARGAPSGRCGPRPRPRTPPIPTPSTSTA